MTKPKRNGAIKRARLPDFASKRVLGVSVPCQSVGHTYYALPGGRGKSLLRTATDPDLAVLFPLEFG